MRKLVCLPVLVVGLALATAACGSSSSSKSAGATGSSGTTTTAASSGGSGGTTSKAAFVAKADGICKAATAQAGNPPGDPSSAKASDLPAWNTYLQKTVSLGMNLVNQLKALTPPSADQATYSNIVQQEATALTDLESAQQAAASGNLSDFQAAFKKSETSGQSSSQAASAYGMTDC